MPEFISIIENTLLELAKRYQSFAKDETLKDSDIKEFDKELGDLLLRFKELRDIKILLSESEFYDLVKQAELLISQLNI